MTAIPDTIHTRALILAPNGRDATVAEMLLKEAGVAGLICADLAALQDGIGEDACFVVATEEALRSADLRPLVERLAAQPDWSDLAFIVLTRRGGGPEHNAGAARLSELLGNVTFLERPFHPTTFVSLARTVRKGRQRQYETRARMEELHEGEERLRTALLAGRLGSLELDLSTRALTISDPCRALFGRAPGDSFDFDDLVGSIDPDDRWMVLEGVERSARTGEDYSAEFRHTWPDRSLHWAEMRARVVQGRRGRPPRLVGVVSDVTHRKRAEEHLRNLNETLEDRIEERTAELNRAHAAVLAEIAQRERAEEQLRQAQKMEMIGQLTGGVAHDFNNLLMAILGNLDLLRKYVPADPRATRLIDSALQGAQRGAALTQRLLAFARRQDLQVTPGSLVGLVTGMTELLRRSVGPQIDLRIELPPALPLALVDTNQLELALLNLVVNARDAMPHGGVLRIEADRAEATGEGTLSAGSYVRLIVTDTGQGMDAETLEKATEPFFSTKELGKGTGLGLSMIHGLAIQLNGALVLSSEVGRGTRAELWLPVTDAVPEPSVDERKESPEQPEPSKFSVLVVDDDILIAMSTVAMLEDLGHEVFQADSGEEALQILRSDVEIDLLLTDFSMPKMTGGQLARAARELRPDLPVLLATGYAELPPNTEIDLPRLGKPYQQDRLAAEIDKLLNGKTVAGKGAAALVRGQSGSG